MIGNGILPTGGGAGSVATKRKYDHMRYKSKVLTKRPEAKTVVLRRYPDMEPRYVAVFVGKRRLDIYDPEGADRSWGGRQQLSNAAWRSAYYFLVREDSAKTRANMDKLMAPFVAAAKG